MDKREFSQIRSGLEKTQDQLAQLLGISIKAVQSFEQGWRNIPVHTERQLLFLLTLKRSHSKGNGPCWVIRKCPPGDQTKMPCMGISRWASLLVY